MHSASWRRYAVALIFCLAGVLDVSAGTFTLFGPRTFTRNTAAPVTERVTFPAPSTSGYVLHIESDGVASAVVTLNGTQILGPSDFKPSVTAFDKAVTLRASNVLTVELRSKPGSFLRISVVGNDDRAPQIKATATPAANAAGWNNQDVTVTFTCSDAESGMSVCPAPVVVSSEGAGQVITGEAVDAVGNRATASVTLNIDKTAPAIVPSASPAANADGWNNGDVTVSFGCVDALSGVAQCAAPVVITGSGAGLPAAGSVTDRAGNTATVSVPVNIDRTVPRITARLSAPANAGGWHSSPVTVEFDCADDGAGIASCSAPVTISGEGASQTAKGLARDRAGNVAEATASVNVDLTGPTITATLSTPPNAAGWHQSDVTVTFACEDLLSGVAECPAPRTVSAEGTQALDVTVLDKAGHSSTSTTTVRIDRTLPTIAYTLEPAPNAEGWHNAPVVVTFTCNDAGSGVAECPAPATVATSAAAQLVAGSVVDRAGNRATSEARLNLDLAAPSIRAVASASGAANGAVVVTFECSDELSGIAICPAPVTVTEEGANQIVEGVATDKAGNSARATTSVTIDRTRPTISATAAPAPNAAGWHQAPQVVVSFTCADTGSGVVACPDPVTVTAEGAAQQVSGTVRDQAGNTATATLEISIDRTPPVITPQSSVSGWTNGDVTVRFVCSDSLSGVEHCTEPVSITADGSHDITGAAVDRAGNAASAAVTVMVDRTPPTIAASADRAPNAAGWYNAPLTVSFACADAASGIASCTDPVAVSENGAARVVNGTATDNAGNTSGAALTVNLDTVAPEIRAITTPGWTNGDVVVSFECADTGGSGIATCPAQITVTADGATEIEGAAVDVAGNTTTVQTTVQVDRTPPTIAARASRAANANGWYNASLRVEFECADTVSSVATCPAPIDVTTDGAGQVISGTAVDAAGNQASASLTINLDTAVPTIVPRLTPPGAWAGGPVTIAFDCADALSGVAECAAPVTLSNPGAGQVANGEVTDRAGNVATVAATVNIDLTAPEIHATVAPAANAAGWHTGAVTVTFECSDAASGIASCTAPVSVTDEGQGLVITGNARDVAGNTATASATVNVDRTAPAISIASPQAGSVLREPAAAISGSVLDDVSGLVSVTCGGTDAVLSGSNFICSATLVNGPNTIEIAATDRAGNVGRSTLALTLNANTNPVARAGGPYVGETGAAIRFDGSQSTDAEGQALTFTWTFGDGGTATGMSPARTFTAPGSFSVELTVTDTQGASSSSSSSVTVARANRVPAADAGGPYTGDAAQTITFTAAGSADPDGDALSYAWSFGDGSTATGSVVRRSYSTPGSFTAEVTVNDGRGGIDTATAQVTVRAINQRPTAQIGGPYNGNAGQPVLLSGSGSDPDNDPLTYSWSFSDGGSATGASASHIFTAPGTFTASLTVTDGRGGSHAASTQVLIASPNGAPVAQIAAPARADAGAAVTFSAAGSSDPDSDPLTYSWSFGDGRSSTGSAPQHAFAAAGTFTVRLTVTDSRGASDTASASIAIDAVSAENRAPVASAGGPYAGEVNIPVGFTASGSTDPDGDALTYAWDFGDGSTATGVAPIHAFSEVRVHVVTLTVSDSRGLSHSATTQVNVGAQVDRAPPVLTLQGPRSVLPGTRARIQALVSDNVAVASVTFESGGIPGAPIPTAPYEYDVVVPDVAAPGAQISVKATARDAAGNASSAEIALTITAEPDNENPVVALLAPPSAAPGSSVHLSANASDNDGVASVTFTVAGVVIAIDTQAPYEAAYAVPVDAPLGTPIQAGAKAQDHTGNTASASTAIAVVETTDTVPPTVLLTAPATVAPGGTIAFSADVTDNTGVAAVIFSVDGARVATLTEAPYAASYAVPTSAADGMLVRVEARAVDFAGLEGADVRHTQVMTAAAAEAFVIGEVFDDATGLPMMGAAVTVTGAVNAAVTTDERGRFALNAGTGDVVLRIAREGYTTVERRTVAAAGLRELIDARLTPRAAASTQIAPVLGGTLTSGGTSLIVPAGAVTAPVSMALTVVGAQGLVGLLPTGWSPVAVIDIAPHGTTFALPATLRVPAPVGGAALTLATWDWAEGAWRAIASGVDNPTELDAAISESGQFAWIRPDVLPTAPPQPAVGQIVTGVAAVDVPADAGTIITPQPKIIFYQPGVTADVRGVLTSPAPLPSGTRLWARISESYTFFSGAQMYPDPTVQDIFFYQSEQTGQSLAGAFIVSPSRTFEALTLERGIIGLELYVPADTGAPGAVIPAAGGSVSLQTGERLDFADGASTGAIAASLRRLSAEELGAPVPGDLEFIGALDVALSGAAITKAGVLSIAKPAALAADAQVLLARVATLQDRTRLVLVAIGRIDGDRIVAQPSLPLNGTEMEGVRSSGRYVFVRPLQPTGFVAGQVIDQASAPVGGAQVSTETLSLVAISRPANGVYVAAARAGTVNLTALNLQTADRGLGTIALAAARDEAALDLRLVAEPPRVTSATPAAGATGVPQSSAVVLIFSEAIDPASVTGNISLASASDPVIQGTVSLSGGNTLLTFRPAAALDPDTQYTFTLGGTIADASGQAMGTPFVLTFTTLDTTAPLPPAAGTLSASIPEGGNTTVRGAQGIAGQHDTVSIENITRGTSTPVLLDPNGGFVVLVQASPGDTLKLKIVDQSGNEAIVEIPGFTRQNADGSISGVVGSGGGRIDGPDGTAVEVPAGSLPDGTVVTIRSVLEAGFPVQLTEEQKTGFAYAGGIDVDFGGVTPNRYVNISVAPKPGDTVDDQWIVAQAMTVAGQPVFNAIDTAKMIAGRVRTSSPPCPGVLAAGTYGIYKSAYPVGLAFGRMYSNGSYDGLRFSVGVVPTISGFAVPFPVYAWENPLPICLPVLTGRVTVNQNTTRFSLEPDALNANDREIIIRNVTAGNKESHFRREVLEYAFEVTGLERHSFTATIVSTTGQQIPATSVDVKPGPAGKVIVSVDPDDINVPVATIVIRNTSLDPVVDTTFAISDLQFELAAGGGTTDVYSMTAIDADGVSRLIQADKYDVLPSVHGTGNLLARALTGTIDPTKDEYLAEQPPGTPDPVKWRERVDLITLDPVTKQETGRLVIPAGRIVHGGFYFAFNGNESHDYAVEVVYNTGESEYVRIHRLRLIVQNPQTGKVIKTIEVSAPPVDEPYGVGPITNDGQPPLLTGSPVRMNSFDPSTPLTFTFSEAMDADSIRQNAMVERILAGGGREIVQGTWRIYNQNRSATFVPDAPLRVGEEYSVTLVGADSLGGVIAPGAQPVTDLGGNSIGTLRMQVKTYAPRVVASVTQGANGRPMDEIYDVQIRRVEENNTSKTYLFATTNAWQDGPKFLVFDATKAEETKEVGFAYGGSMQKQLTLVPDLGKDGNPALKFRTAQPGPPAPPPCGGVGPLFSGDIAISVGHNIEFSFLQVWVPGDPVPSTQPGAAPGSMMFTPCMITSKLLTANPDTLNTYTRPGTIHATGFAEAVATVRHEDGVAAFTAIRDVGLFATDIGKQIPEPFPVDRQKDAFVSGDYYDVVALQDRLLAANNGGKSLDIFDANLAQIGSVALPGGARHVVVAEDYGVDEDNDGFIRPNEIRDLAFVATRDCPGGPTCTYTIQVVDLKSFASPEVIGYIDMPGFVFGLDIDPVKRRLFASGYTNTTQQSSAFYMIDISRPAAFAADGDQDGQDDRIIWKKDFPTGINAPRIDKERGLAYLPVVGQYASRKGRLEVWAIYDNCCDLAVDFTAAPAKKESGNRDGLLRKERDALREGIRLGLDAAAATCQLNPATVSILEQGSGACLWRGRCDDNYQPGLSDHDFEIFVPDAAWDVITPGGKNIAMCTADVMTDTFIDRTTGEPREIRLPSGDTMTFDDITFFPEVRERFESATFDVEVPNSSGSDAVGDMGLGRRSLLLKWLVEGAYVTGVNGYAVEGRSLDAILADLKNVTRIPRLEGYEWSVLQDFNLAKSKAFVRIAGASKPDSAFHKLFVKQLHDAGKAGIRATMARLVAHPVANTMVLDVTRSEFDTSACLEVTVTVTNPRAWLEKPCSSFEEYVASVAAKTLREGMGLFTFEEIVNQAHRFYRVKSDRERIVSEQPANTFIALAAQFIANTRVVTQPIYNQMLPNDPEMTRRTSNMGLALNALTKALEKAKLPLVPHVSSRGFRNGTGLRVAMYHADNPGAGNLEKEVRVDLAGGDDRYLTYVRNANGTLALANGKAQPLFQLEVNQTQNVNQPRGVSFIIDLPDRTMKESNRLNNVGGFFYYVLDRSNGQTPSHPAAPHFPLSDSTLLNPSPECYDSPTLLTTQRLTVGGQNIGDQVVLGRGEAVTIHLTVQNMSAQSVAGVQACSNITNQCYDIGTLAAGAVKTIQVDYVTPDEDIYIDGTPSAFSPETGILNGGDMRIIVNGDSYVIQPMMDEATVAGVDPDLLTVEAGGRVLRHYRIVGKRSGQPKPGLTVTAELEGFFGSQVTKQQLTFQTNAQGEICTPGGGGCGSNARGLEIPYQASMITSTSYNVTLKQVDGVDISGENFTTFAFDLKDRAYSQSYSVGGQIGGGVKILAGVDLDVEDGFELSKSGKFFTGPTELGLSISRQITFKAKAEAKLGIGIVTPLLSAKAELKAGLSASSPTTFTDTFAFPYVLNANPQGGAPPFILEFDAHCAIATLTTNQLANKNPVINKIADLLREQPCGDPGRFATSHAVKGGVSLTGAAGLEVGLQSPLFGQVGKSRPTLGVNFGASGTASVSVEHETSVAPDPSGASAPTGFKTSVNLFGQLELSASLGLSLDDAITQHLPGDPPAAPKQQREDFFSLKAIKQGLSAGGTSTMGGALGLSIDQSTDGVVNSVSISFAQPKSFGWTADAGGDGVGINQGAGVGSSVSFTVSRTDDKVAVLERIASLQGLASVVTAGGSESSLLELTPTKINDEIAKLRLLLFNTVATYKISQIEGSGIELPFGFEGQLGKVGLGAKLSFKGDSKMAWVSERGVNYKGTMLPLQTYKRDAYLPAIDMGLASFIAQMWESVNASFGPAYSFVGAAITPGTPNIVVQSPNTAILTIDGTKESEAWEASLYSYKFREIAGPVADAPNLPTATAGPAGQPHYGVGGFHHFGPLDRALGAPTPLVIDYKDPDIIGLDETTFGVYGWNEETKDWDHLGGVIDTVANTVTTTVDRLRTYTLAPAMPARTVEMTGVDQGATGAGESARRRFTVTSAPLVMNNGQAVPDGTLFTVRSFVAGSTDETSFGTIITVDADAARANTQIAVVNGRLQFEVEYNAPLGLYIPGKVVVHSTTGTAYGELALVKGEGQ